MDLEHLYPANNMIRLRLSANFPAVKGLIQSASLGTNFENVKSNCCKQNNEVTRCITNVWSSWKAKLIGHTRNPEPIVVRGNQLTTLAVNST